jgi:hypothetical protein
MHVVQCGPSKRRDAIPPAGVPDQPSPFKAATRPPLLPLPAHKPYPTTRGYQQREKAERARREQNPRRKATTSASASPAGPHRIALALARSPISPQASRRSDPPLRRGVAGRFRGQQFSPCCCCCESRDSIRALLPWRRPPEPRALRGLVTSRYQPLFLLPTPILACLFLALAICLMRACTPRSGSGDFGSFRTVPLL